MIRRAFACVVVLIALAGCSTNVPAPAAPEPVELVAAHEKTVDVNGLARTYLVQAPVDVSKPLPLLIVMHGASGNAANIESLSGIRADDFIVAFPNGTPRREAQNDLAWNAGRCCGRPSADGVDDVGFITALVADVEATYSVDPERIYLAGFSNGGMMAYRLACELGDGFAGIAVVSGSFNAGDCPAPSSLRVLIIHGTGDPTLPYEGSGSPISITSVPQTALFWAEANGCSVDPVETTDETVTSIGYGGCDRDSTVQLTTVDGGGHVWATPADTSALILEFFGLH
jgi:polyhydroxybutyrate depolymerase